LNFFGDRVQHAVQASLNATVVHV